MQKFKFKAWDENFKVVQETIEEEDIEAAKEKIRARGLKLVSINKVISLSNIKIGRKTLKDEDVASICGQIGIIVNAGVNILAGLEVLKKQNKKLSVILDSILMEVRRGNSLGVAMEASGAFPKLLTDMVKSGELSGNVDEVLFNMESYYQREADLKGKIKSASIYPLILLGATVGMIAFFNIFIFSSLKDLFSDMESLPGATVFLLNTMNFLNNSPFLLLFIVVALVLLFIYLKGLPKVGYWLDKVILRFPVYGNVKQNILTTRFTRSMGIFMKSAVPLLSSLESMEAIIGNKYMSQKINIAKGTIITGGNIADSFEEQNLFDPLVIQMIRIGEETGRIEEMLLKLSAIYDKKVETGISRMVAMIEPTFTLIVGLLVGFVIVAVILPILQMSNMVG